MWLTLPPSLLVLSLLSGAAGAAWAAGSAVELGSRRLGAHIPALLGELAAGIAVSAFLGAISSASASSLEASTQVRLALLALGQAGLVLIVFQAGMHVDLSLLRSIGAPAFLVAVSGTVLPVVLAVLLLSEMFGAPLTASIVAGTALSSTSIGTAVEMLASTNAGESWLGQLVAAAALLDDVLSLLILAVVQNIAAAGKGSGEEQLPLWAAIFWPVGASAVVALLAGAAVRLKLGVRFVEWTGRVGMTGEDGEGRWDASSPRRRSASYSSGTEAKGDSHEKSVRSVDGTSEATGCHCFGRIVAALFRSSSAARENAMLSFCFVASCASGFAGTTHLLGAFAAGIVFAPAGAGVECWERRFAELTAWLSRIFFLSIGLSVPVAGGLFTAEAVGVGALNSAAAVVGKLVTGVFVPFAQLRVCGGSRKRAARGEYSIFAGWTLGWAMVGRGELGFVMAREAHASGLLDDFLLSVTVWALLVATLVSPLVFGPSIQRNQRLVSAGPISSSDEEYASSADDVVFVLNTDTSSS
jgi:Kef-type K+ transport system membrane component KefB